jgi:hypothetical protein
MRVLIGCESSGVVRDAFRILGHDAWSCDTLEVSKGSSNYHIQGDLLETIYDRRLGGWDLLIAHPPCTFLCSSGLHWNKRVEGRAAKTVEALDFVRELMVAPIEHIAIENPVGCIGTKIRKADQYIQPYNFGHDASKRTGLWLKNLPLLASFADKYVEGRVVVQNGKSMRRWANQTDSGQNKLGPSADRWQVRSETYTGIAQAMAVQWGTFVAACVRLGI